MNFDPANLPDDIAELKGMLASLATSYTDLEQKSQEKIHYLEEQIRLLKNELFGRKSEKLTKEERLQLLLFNEAEDALDSESEAAPDEIPVKPYSRKLRSIDRSSKAGNPLRAAHRHRRNHTSDAQGTGTGQYGYLLHVGFSRGVGRY